MTRRDSAVFKGVAIIFMLFLHLFNHLSEAEACTNYIYLTDFDGNKIPLVHWLSHATTPVGIFLIISGYGLYMADRNIDRHRWTRIWKLLSHWALIFSCFFLIALILYPDKYPFEPLLFFKNLIGYNITYNAEMWFLPPFILLSVLSPWFFKVQRKSKLWLFLTVCLAIRIGSSAAIMKLGNTANDPYLIRILLDTGRMGFDFGIGAVAAQYEIFNSIKEFTEKRRISSILIIMILVILIAAKCFINYHFFGYEFFLICLLLLCPRSVYLDNVLAFLGAYSMNMWMIHSWFCYYLFHDEIYSLQYPALIFISLLGLSVVSAIFVEKLYNLVSRIFTSFFHKLKMVK